MREFLAATALLLSIITVDATAAADSAELSAELRAAADKLTAESLEARLEGVRALADSKDPAALPFLAEAMGAGSEDNPAEMAGVRSAATRGLVVGFPDRALAVLEEMLRNGSRLQREAASYGLGDVESDRAIDLALELLASDDPAIQRGASVAILRRGRTAATASQLFAYGTPGAFGLNDQQVAAREPVLDRLTDLITKNPGPPGWIVYRLVHQLGDSATTEKIVEAYLGQIAGSDPELAGVLGKLHRVNRHWLGRPAPPAVDRIDYAIETDNLADSIDRYRHPVSFRPDDVEVLNYRGIRPERGTRLILPVDALLSCPQAASPRLVELGPTAAKIEYQVPSYSGVDVSIGIPGVLESWRGTVGAVRGSLAVDPERGVPLRDQLFDAQDRMVAQVEFSEFTSIAPGHLAPLQIRARVRSAKRGWLRYDLRYQVVDPQVWVFLQGEAFQSTAEGETPRARAELLDLSVTTPRAAPPSGAR